MIADALSDRGPVVRALAALVTFAFLGSSCSRIVYQPAPVVPTKSPLPYSVKIRLAEIESYMVEPGATMIADPRLENHVTGVNRSLEPAKKEWEKSVAEYLANRKTFTYVSMDSQTDMDLIVRLNIYIDPGVLFTFNHVYIARIDVTLTGPRTGPPLNYLSFGKSSGDVSRGGEGDDQGPINQAVQSALNDVFGKIEQDPRLRR